MWYKIWVTTVAFLLGGLLSVHVRDWQIEKTTGAAFASLIEFKRDCEKSLPRDKVCVMVFDYVPVENDYEQ